MDAFETLMKEHRLIEQVLGSLQVLSSHIAKGAPPGTLAEFVEFFRGYADHTHHGKEENLLFTVMSERGFSQEAGPVAVMLYDHGQGRERVASLARASLCGAELSDEVRTQVVCDAKRYASLLGHHIYKEDTILFPMARGALRPSDLRRLDRDFARFDQSNPSASLRQLAAALIKQFPPEPSSVESSDPFGDGCDLHCTLAGCVVRNPWEEMMFPDY